MSQPAEIPEAAVEVMDRFGRRSDELAETLEEVANWMEEVGYDSPHDLKPGRLYAAAREVLNERIWMVPLSSRDLKRLQEIASWLDQDHRPSLGDFLRSLASRKTHTAPAAPPPPTEDQP